MSAWAEIKHSVNSDLGTKKFAPLNKIVEKEAYKNYYRDAVINFYNGIDEIKIINEVNFLSSIRLVDARINYFVFPPNELIFDGIENFKGCTALKRIDIPSSVKMEGGMGAFSGCTSLEYANLDFVGEIPESFFSGCTQLSFVRISKNISAIRQYAFANLSLEKIIYGGTIEEWNEIEKDVQWRSGTTNLQIECTDGTIEAD